MRSIYADDFSTRLNRLGQGLRINGQKPDIATPAETDAAKSPQETAEANPVSKSNKLVHEKFAETLLRRLQNDKENPKTPEEAQALADSVVNTVEEIKKQFGDQAANQAMAGILSNTERRVSADHIAAAVSDVLKSLFSLNKSVMAKPNVTEEEYAQAQAREKKLQGMLEFLNRKEETESSSPKGLAAALNGYYGQPGQNEADQKRFSVDFTWETEAVSQARNKADMDYFTISVDEFGRENLNELIDFLRNDLNDDEAASIIENLSGGDDIFEAVEKVRDLFYADSYKVTSFLAHHEGAGMEKIGQLNLFLDLRVLDKVNDCISNNSEVKNRMLRFAARQFGSDNIPENCGVGGWPGGMSGWVSDGEHSWRDGLGRPDIHFAQLSGATAQERDIGLWKGNADFQRQLAESGAPGWNKEALLAGADECMEIYDDLMAAYKTGTQSNSNYKGFTEMMMLAYQAAKGQPLTGGLIEKEI